MHTVGYIGSNTIPASCLFFICFFFFSFFSSLSHTTRLSSYPRADRPPSVLAIFNEPGGTDGPAETQVDSTNARNCR